MVLVVWCRGGDVCGVGCEAFKLPRWDQAHINAEEAITSGVKLRVLYCAEMNGGREYKRKCGRGVMQGKGKEVVGEQERGS